MRYPCGKKKKCFVGSCAYHGLQLVQVCALELPIDKMLKWKSIVYKAIGTTFEGIVIKTYILEHRWTIPHEVIQNI